MKKQFLEAGRIINTHGIRGELKVEPWTNGPEFLTGFKRFFIDETPVKVLSSRIQKGFVFIILEGVNDIDSAVRLKNRILYIDRDDAILDDGEYFLQDIIGLSVLDNDSGAELGKLADILDLPSGNVYVVRGDREILIPAVPEFIKRVDVDNGTVSVKLIEGM